jgi:hypothetical protein
MWIINMVEWLKEKSQKNLGTTMGRKEVDAKNELVMLLRVVDAFLFDEFWKIGQKSFTWSKNNLLATWLVLDRFYVNFSIQVQASRNRTWPTMGHVLGHALVFLKIYLKKSKSLITSPSIFRWFKMTFISKSLWMHGRNPLRTPHNLIHEKQWRLVNPNILTLF